MTTEIMSSGCQGVQAAETKPSDILIKLNLPVTLKFVDVVHKIKIKSRVGLFSKKVNSRERLILKGIGGAVLPGELLALLGPSGSGKTTLLTALAGQLFGLTSGTITYNDKPFSKSMKRKMGFVAQKDIFYPHLSVSETLVFTALLRLPNSLTKEEKISQAQAVMNQLNLTHCKNTIMGGPLLRGVSGGERRRVSIGQELLLNPSLLLLDEPTSGLDSTTASRIVLTLSELAKGGRTIVMTLHQPSSRLFYMFQKVLLLSEGSSLYFGKGENVMDYFSSMGYVASVTMNPSDFLLDLANGIYSGNSCEDRDAMRQALVSAYESNLANQVNVELDNPGNQFHDVSEDGKFGTTWWLQFSLLLKRGLKERKYESFRFLIIGQILGISFISGFLWWQSGPNNIQDQVGLLFFYSKFLGSFPCFQSIHTFPRERKMLIKERSSGMYRLSSYFMARNVGDLPMELALPALLVTITYWMGGLKPNPINFLHTLAVSLFYVLVAQGLGQAVGALVKNQKRASTLGSVVMTLFVLVNGYYIQHMPAFISWIKYTSLSYYAYKLLLGSQYKVDEIYWCASNVPCLIGNLPGSVKQTGLDKQGFSVAALGIMLVGYRLVAYFALLKAGVKHK
ncbi:ABC transporter G family member [Quillaja saponaria]|uniref:ABC transporter G family member n=1 Tax=Quillaja saponaria TaxID=32244 RepID=A0AAD7KW83_QUISA|nr:ABC transporter G family member [Quillaja saponaria]